LFCFLFVLLQAREAAKSGEVLFNEAMAKFDCFDDLALQFSRFEKAAAKGHRYAKWTLMVVKEVINLPSFVSFCQENHQTM
jgi:hypothetical protein